MKFPKISIGYNISFFNKQVTDEKKFAAIKDEIYGVLSMDELRSMKITEKNLFRIEKSHHLF